jgi:hypothetical protein
MSDSHVKPEWNHPNMMGGITKEFIKNLINC